MDESQRREIYDLYRKYEKLKQEMHYYDECDLVYNIAGRIALLTDLDSAQDSSSLLPVDALFVE